MVDEYKVRFSTLIEAIQQHLPTDAPVIIRQFVAHYYAKMPLMDLERLDPERACLIARNSFEFFKNKGSNLQIRVFHPTREEHGWKENRLIIEVHNDDMSFILDSLTAELSRLGFAFYETIHPIIFVKREKSGALKQLAKIDDDGDLPAGVQAESFIHFQLSSMPTGVTEEQIISNIRHILSAVNLVVQDWRVMVDRAKDVMKRVSQSNKYFGTEEVREVKDFLTWLCDKNFVFLGCVDYDFYDKQGNEHLRIVPGSELGLFKIEDAELKPQGLQALPPEVLHFAIEPRLIEITKSNRKSSVHRNVLMDYISIKRLNESGKVIGESRFLGLFTSTVYYQSADRIPFIRLKIARTLQRANFDPLSHNGKQLKAILEFYPRDELFQIGEEDLFHFCIGLMSLEAKPAVKLFVRKDRFERFMSCMVYIPRERHSTYLREQIELILARAYAGKVSAFFTNMGDSPLARVHIIIATAPGKIPDVDTAEIEEEIAKITNRWADSLRSRLAEKYGEEQGDSLALVYANAFPESYIQLNSDQDAVADIAKIQQAITGDGLAVDLFKRKKESDDLFHLKIYTTESERALSDMLPMLENLGCRVLEMNPFVVTPKWNYSDILIRDFQLQANEEQSKRLTETSALFEDALQRVWNGEIDNDTFNALVLKAAISWRDIQILRTYCQYLRQTGFAYSREYVADALGKHPVAARHIIDAFYARFDPAGANAASFDAHISAIETYLDGVSNIAEDRILRRLTDVLLATLRTNFFQKTAAGHHKPYLSFKFRSSMVPELPQPVPYAEIFVYSMKTEGIHLRGDRVARGGLRWSDRPEDFRTEVHGLMKAQMVKNSVIVPQGSKGGFVVKQPPASGDRDAVLKSGIASYQEFLSGLLDITDNIKDGTVVPPTNVVRVDDDDPYLVVAADKGTATFSDIANALAKEYGFWLGDAFASGGSAGYDHKAMAITARGGWVSVSRHFMEMGIDITKQDFTVIGIGDMSGDVFGNGMVLSDHIRLLGAFNHRHIFLDPNPDAKRSFDERKRLFALPRSSWDDYDTTLISKGGGVFGRDQKTIPLSPEVKAMLDATQDTATPDELIRLMLKARADLLWNGGIGTYIKASEQSNEDVGDRANNAVRINGKDCRCKVIGEGGNLGMTQLGRIEYARTGGRLNTDAIDNSAGVDCSDHEVNIKIALSDAIAKGKLTLEERNKLLTQMTDDVAHLVLIDNRLQTQALTIAENQGFRQLDSYARLMGYLESDGFLDREVEFLPSDRQIGELRARKQSLTRPELAILLSYSKLALYRDLKDSSMVEDDYFIDDLMRYFPEPMRTPFRESILSHRLRKEIVATIVTNSLVNRAGITFASSVLEETGVHPCDLARGYVICRDAFKLRDLWSRIESLTGTLDAAIQSEMFVEISQFLERVVVWFLRNSTFPINIQQTMQHYAAGIRNFAENFESLMSDTLRKAFDRQAEYYTAKGVPLDLAKQIAGLEALSSACDIVQVANQYQLSIPVVGRVYFEIGAQMRLGWLRRSAKDITPDGYWDRLALKSLIYELYHQQRRVTSRIVETLCKDNECNFSVEQWYEQNAKELERYYRFIDDLKSQETVDMAKLVVAVTNVESVCSL